MKDLTVGQSNNIACIHTEESVSVRIANPLELRRVNQKLLSDIACAAIRAGIKEIGFSALIDGHRLYTRSGNISRHARGLAADINRLNGHPLTSQPGKELANRLVKQLRKLGYVLNRENGNPRAVLWQTDGHWRHIHVSRTD